MNTVEPFAYRRTSLAVGYCDALEGRGVVDASSGLFLAAPRRTGKSTFLRADLIPQMNLRGWETLYVDLWAARARDPADLIAAVIAKALAGHDGPVLKAAKQIGLDKLNVMGALSLDLSTAGKAGNMTLPEAFECLREKCKKPIALLVDEAQHALATEAGIQTMFALKAARDQLNQGTKTKGLFLVMTGSNRDKLAHLVVRKSEPFYGAGVTRFPLLDRGFVEAYAAWLNPQFVEDRKFSVEALDKAFELVGRRPEMLKQVVGEAVADFGGASALDQLLANNARLLQSRAWGDFESSYNGLSAIQKAVLDAVARLSPGYEPFSEKAHACYKVVLGKALTASSVQSALDALRDRELIWKAGRGDYAFEDDGLREWYLDQNPQPPACPLLED